MKRIMVKIADYRIAVAPALLLTHGLGSCLAVVLYDPVLKIAGMGHIMLPRGDTARASGNPKKFADLCIAEMLKELQDKGCKVERIVAKMAGGASMFDIPYKENFSIGERNRDSVVSELLKMKIPLMGEDTGGNYGRTVEFHTDSGNMVVISLKHGKKII